jgi:UPF0755 protein
MGNGDDWLDGDHMVDPSDPDAVAREQRRREREERRGGRAPVAAEPEPPRPPAEPQSPSPPPVPPSSPPPPRGRGRGRPLLIAAAIGAIGLAILAVVVVAIRYFDREPPPPVVVKTITVTIPEGLSRAQIAEVAQEAGLKGDYVKASAGHEGFLFPDTFELRRGAPASDLVQLQLEDFKRRVRGVDMGYARSKNLDLHDVVTIASMVEEEAMLEDERKLVAAVIYNRLRAGMPLGIDATTRFATGNYTEPLTESELAEDSPYNTRLNAGLPPGPIDNPGLASIEAAAHPAKVDYLYYVVKPGACGEHSFSSSDAEFQADVARYNEAREAAGGQSPDTCEEG